jgi:hypothetical protein
MMLRKLTAAVALAALGLVGACGGGGDDSDDAATTTTEADSGEPTTTAAENERSDGAGISGDALIPAEVGNQWVYRLEYPPPVGAVTLTEEVTNVEESGDAPVVTVNRLFHYDDGSQPDFDIDIRYTYNPDGSISLPANSFFVSGDTFESSGTEGEVAWLPYDELVAGGAPVTGSATGSISLGDGGTVDAEYTYTVSGGGAEDVTVPAGTYTGAAVMNLELNATATSSPAGPLTIAISMKMWFVKGIGLVKQEVAGGDFLPGTVQELVETNVSS